ncbi:hypothetical protein TVAG_192930 [Trichomonas vaginalis G3]|uniref:WH2 motif family protein n=1 Tax=Trichomonas vaginalis (strain ATCC PRA-98 / G3) TaxID=412133 RepID=A2DH07_TRIV3|nr:hypothetical protein TVAGG3_0341730 [Trichomonas vaginalis G3]EAY20317.1 hypothetical protein TVAG_192930 [Trichomonas vaginalis G3]KAI5530694.1 hypothetical protein TVAGG3_0341730 [Trichomonas vaginalis G3]|eukprot:XP_001581303.1 hypothetical protein [Trichomonas vaginalis G3]
MYPACVSPCIYDPEAVRSLTKTDFIPNITSYENIYNFGIMKQMIFLQKAAIEIFKDLDIAFNETELRLYNLQTKVTSFNEFSAKIIHQNSKKSIKDYKHPSKVFVPIPKLNTYELPINSFFQFGETFPEQLNLNNFENLIDNVNEANLELSDPKYYEKQLQKELLEKYRADQNAPKRKVQEKVSQAEYEIEPDTAQPLPFDSVLPPNTRLNAPPPKGETQNWRHKGHYVPRSNNLTNYGVGGGKRVPQAARGIQVGNSKKSNMGHITVDIFEKQPRQAPILKLVQPPRLQNYPNAISVPTIPTRQPPKLIDCELTTRATSAFSQMEMRQRVELDLSFVVRNDVYLKETVEENSFVSQRGAPAAPAMAPPPTPPPPPPPSGLPPPPSPSFDLSSAPKLKSVQTNANKPPTTAPAGGGIDMGQLKNEIQNKLKAGLTKVTPDMVNKPKQPTGPLTHLDLIKAGNFKLRKISEDNRPPPKPIPKEKEINQNELSLEELLVHEQRRREAFQDSEDDERTEESTEDW